MLLHGPLGSSYASGTVNNHVYTICGVTQEQTVIYVATKEPEYIHCVYTEPRTCACRKGALEWS